MNSENTMPERVFYAKAECGYKTRKVFPNAITKADIDEHGEFEEYIHHETVTELQRQNAVLKAFARSVVNENCFGYDGEVDGATAQEQAAACGIIIGETVTREMMDRWARGDECYPSGDFMTGDEIFKFAPWMLTDAAMPQQSRAQVAREFLDVVVKRAGESFERMQKFPPGALDFDDALQKRCVAIEAGKVLKQWEAAEENDET